MVDNNKDAPKRRSPERTQNDYLRFTRIHGQRNG
jgi:hypothetical protein